MDMLLETAWHGDPSGGTLLLDPSRGMFTAIGGVKGSLFSLAKPSVISRVLGSKRAGFAGNLEGDGMTMGGVVVVSKAGVVFQHLESEFGDRADPDEVVKAAARLVAQGQ
eukprot:TRINITY_DN2215_c0_g1_i1.p2 TRINITY_DN2215_c0_g1~~TRINITY_DN2215_c0_g1_i1.p2  ORF type:complete len:110 (-),score=26.97 TRINITY_DN2215_c0_g1_i1:248-577(-)